MNLLLVPVPVFNRYASVEAYIFRYRLSGDASVDELYDPTISPLLKALNVGGVEAFTGGKTLFVPIDSNMLFSELERQCRVDPQKIVFLIQDPFPVEDAYLSCISFLKQLGFRFASYNCPRFDEPQVLLRVLDYVILREEALEAEDIKVMILRYKRGNPNLRVIATGITHPDQFQTAMAYQGDFFEGSFYAVPVTQEQTKLTPLKANLVHLLNVVRDENFEFDTIAGIVQRDTALTISLMRFINSPYLGIRNKIKTIRHAVTILGQDEVRKWVTAAVFRSLGTDRPSELVRLSLVRAKLAENLSPLFGMAAHSQSLFLTGLFSVLDVVLQTTMSGALDSVSVSDEIRDALESQHGPYVRVLDLMLAYERADWDAVIGICEASKLQLTEVYRAYIDAVAWYNELLSDRVRPLKK